MGLKKGQTNNPKGRKKGVPNKTTGTNRQILQAFLDKNLQKMQKEYNKLSSKDKLFFIDKVLKYTTPTLNSVEANLAIDYENISDEQLLRIVESSMKMK